MAISEPLGSGLFVGTIAFAAVILGSRAEQKVGLLRDSKRGTTALVRV